MRTLEYLSPDRQQATRRETMDIYAPLAHVSASTDEVGARDLLVPLPEPEEYRRISEMVASRRTDVSSSSNASSASCASRSTLRASRTRRSTGREASLLHQGEDAAIRADNRTFDQITT